MRVFKFRAWDNGKMHNVSFNNLAVNFHHPSGILYLREEQCPFGTTHKTELMQYTGLKDKNGKEIYEGDILQWQGINYVVHIGEFGVREFETEEIVDMAYGVHGKPINETLAPFCYEMQINNGYIKRDGLEVIGNIYENPELLKV